MGMPSLKPAQLAFFSYAHEDAEFALRLAKDLRAGGAAVWIDRLDIKPGQRWDRAVEDALARCPQLLVILSPDATESTNVMDEVSLALEEGKTVLPVVHRQCKIPFRLRRLQYVDLTLNYNEGLGRLLETLGFAVPPSEVPEDAVDKALTRPSTHDGGAKEAKLPSHAAPQERETTARMPKNRAPAVIVIVGTVAVLIALALLVVFMNVIKQQKKRPFEQTAQGPSPEPTQLTASALGTSKPSVAIPETPAQSPMATATQERGRDYETAVAYNKSGIKKAQMGDFAGAVADYDHAIELDPGFAEAYNNRAGAKETMGDLIGAIDDCGRATEIDPNYSLAYIHRACIHYEIRDFRAAIDDFQRVTKISPKAGWPHLFVWLAEMHLGQRERANRELTESFGDRINAREQDRWARIAAFLLDKLTLAEFLQPESPSGSKDAVRHYEALFYAGMKSLFAGDKNEAARYLRSSVEISSVGPEGRAARAELKALGATALSTPTPTAEESEANIATGQTTNVSNLTSAEYQRKINELTKEGLRPVKVWSKQLGRIDAAGASFGYWATFEKDNGTPWVARHGLDAGAYQQEFNKWTAAGYMPTDINVACVGSEVRYCVIYDKIANPPAWIARHGMNEAAFKSENSTWTEKGYNLKLKSSCDGPTGSVFAALWQK